MLNAVNNYNVLGRLGSHYERPEYRPPARESDEGRASPDRIGDRRTLSQAREGAEKKPPAPVPVPARLNLASARNLASSLAAQIIGLPPFSTDREPHAWLRSSLMTPVYV